MKSIIFAFSIAFSVSFSFSQQGFYDLSATDIDGNSVDFSKYKGKKVMIVNVASECGYTPQYKSLQELYDSYRNSGFEILAFPCNQFMGQEPGSASQIISFCEKNYGVTFTLFEKIEVKGKNLHPVYAWLTDKSLNGVENDSVSWNFNKFLIDENGQYILHLKSNIQPKDDSIIQWIESK